MRQQAWDDDTGDCSDTLASEGDSLNLHSSAQRQALDGIASTRRQAAGEVLGCSAHNSRICPNRPRSKC